MPRFILLLSAFLFTQAAHADTLQVAVASNFNAPMKSLAAQFEQDTGHKLLTTFGATGKFYAQIKHGAPFQVLLAGDDQIADKLEKEGAAVAGTRFTYAIGKLVLWSAKPGVVDDQGAVLKTASFKHLAIAAPKVAPYGAAAVQTLTALGLLTATEPKLVQGENISQAFQFVLSGNAQLGFVAMAQVYAGGQLKSGSAWIVPAHLYRPIRQDAIILKSGQGKPAVAAFVQYLKSDSAKRLIRSYGYDL